MKKTTVIAFLLPFTLSVAIAQTNTFPASGNVGIGTTTPRGKFDVDGPGDIFLTDDVNAGSSQSIFLPGHIYLAPYGGSNISYLQARRLDNSGSTELRFRTYDAGTLVETMQLSSSGNVGIRTTIPRAPLDIFVSGNNNTIQTGLIIQQTNPGIPNNTAGVSLDFGIGSGGYQNVVARVSARETYLGTRPKMVFSLWDTNNTMQDRLAIDTYGNVGIGTNSPDQKLTVKGKIHAEEVRVDLSVPAPDYVFESDYNLQPLSEVESFIKENKHLPEVPSAKEMETKGIEVGEMNMILLKKVEELTLYVIELKKENKELKKSLEEIKSQIK